AEPGPLPLPDAVAKLPPDEVFALVKREDAAWRDHKGYSLLFYAASRSGEDSAACEVCRHLIDELGFDVGLASNQVTWHQTPLFFASGPATARVLIERRADVNHQDANKQTPIFYSAKFGNVEV
ncbi:unnamed protein product, partial [Polarella glacialis]